MLWVPELDAVHQVAFSQNREEGLMSWLLLDIQVYEFSLTAIPCSFRDRYYFPISRASSTPPGVQNQAMPWARFHQDGCSGQEKQHANCWAPTLALCLLLSLFLTKFMLHQFMSFLLLYFCNIQLTPQIIFFPRLNLLGAHMRSPHHSALPTKYT